MPAGSLLDARVRQLESEVAALTDTVRQHGLLIESLLAQNSSGSEFELLPDTGEPSSTARPSGPQPAASSCCPQASASAALTLSRPASPAVSVEDRTVVVGEVGAFLRRSLDGLPLHTSGRDRNPLRNRHYIICQDFEGRIFDPPLVVDQFASVRDKCKRGADCGRSIFIGLPSLWEVRIALQEAGLPFPG